MAKAKQTQTATQPTGVPRGVVYTAGNSVLVSTHRRQYVVVTGGKPMGYYTASQAAGHTNAINKFAAAGGVAAQLKLKPCKPAHLQRLPATGKLVAKAQ